MSRACAALALLVFGALVARAAPGVSWYDGGELGAAAATLGVAHPTGFPLFVLLGHAAALVPLGDLGFRVAVLSCALGAATAGVAAWTAWRLSGRAESALCAAALVPFGATALAHATTIEVYALLGLSTAAVLALAAWLASPGDPRRLPAAAFVVGLLLAGHGEMRLLVLPALAVVLWRRRADLGPGALAAAGGACALGLAIHLLLPARSAAGALRDWAAPVTWQAFAEHVTAARIRAAYAGRMFDAAHLSTDLARYASLAARELFMPAVVLVAGLLVRRRAAVGLALSLLAVDAAYSVLVNPMGLPDGQDGVPGFVAAGIAAAALVPSRLVALLAVAPAALVLAAAPAEDASPRRYGAAALTQTGPHGLLLTTSDHLSSLVIWLRDAEGARPDVRHLVRQHASVPVHARGVADLARPGDDPAALARREAARRSVRWEHGDGREEAALLDLLRPGVPTFAVGGAREDPGDPEAFGAVVASDQLVRLGLHDAMRGDLDAAAARFDRARRIDDRSAAALLNLGTVASMRGEMEAAVRRTEEALALAPDEAAAWINLGRYRLQLRRNEAAGDAFARAADLAPGSAAAWSGLGAVAANRGRRDEAVRHLMHALRLDPNLEEARTNLRLLARPAR